MSKEDLNIETLLSRINNLESRLNEFDKQVTHGFEVYLEHDKLLGSHLNTVSADQLKIFDLLYRLEEKVFGKSAEPSAPASKTESES